MSDQAPPSGRLWGYPKGAWLIIAVEMCERFSFYGMLAILVLFLTAPASNGGFQWPDGEALGLLGIYSGLMYALPAFGGYLADHVWGNRRAVTMGASLMVLGHFLMAFPALVPGLVTQATGVPVHDLLIGLGLPLGKLVLPGELGPALTAIAARSGPGAAEAVRLAYRLVGVTFFTALTFLVIGNALMKSTLVVIVGDCFDRDDPKRDGAYAYYYLGISVGAFTSGIVVGLIAERLGWHYGFATAGVLMTVALSLYLGFANRLLGSIGKVPKARVDGATVTRTDVGRSGWIRLGVLLVLALTLWTFEIGWFQMYGSWSLFIERSVDRVVGGFSIPVPWFSAFNALMVIVVTPLVASLLVRMEARGRHVDIVVKYGIALALVAVAQLAIVLAAQSGTTSEPKAHWLLPLAGVTLLSLGELAAWPSTYGIVYRLAPSGLVAAAMGAWYLMTLGAGGYFAGKVAQATQYLGPAVQFGLLAATLAAGALIAFAIRPLLRRAAANAGAPL